MRPHQRHLRGPYSAGKRLLPPVHPPADERRRLQASRRADGEHHRRHRVSGPRNREARRRPEPGGHGGPPPPEWRVLLHRQRRRGLEGLPLRGAHHLLPVGGIGGAVRRLRPGLRPLPAAAGGLSGADPPRDHPQLPQHRGPASKVQGRPGGGPPGPGQGLRAGDSICAGPGGGLLRGPERHAGGNASPPGHPQRHEAEQCPHG